MKCCVMKCVEVRDWGSFMGCSPELIFMLTYNDETVSHARDVILQCQSSKVQYWGMKERPLPFEEMKALYEILKSCGKTTFLEVVTYTEAEGLLGAKLAAACGVDILMGTVFSDTINDYCKQQGLKYMPFVGDISGRPSVLNGSLEEMISEAKGYLAKGVFGIDLLGYRYTGNAVALNQAFVEAVDAPVCLAGSIDSVKRLEEVRAAAPWAFTIGSAFFNHKFPGTICEQLDYICDYMKGEG